MNIGNYYFITYFLWLQSRSSAFLSWGMVANMLPAVLTNLIMGGFSDRKGRKNLFILPTIGQCSGWYFPLLFKCSRSVNIRCRRAWKCQYIFIKDMISHCVGRFNLRSFFHKCHWNVWYACCKNINMCLDHYLKNKSVIC